MISAPLSPYAYQDASECAMQLFVRRSERLAGGDIVCCGYCFVNNPADRFKVLFISHPPS